MSLARLATATGFGAVVLGVAGVAGHVTDGFPEARFTPAQRALLATATANPMRAECHLDVGEYRRPADACEYHAGTLRWAVFGDSHAVELAYALANVLAAQGEKLKHFTYSGCAPSFGRAVVPAELQGCADWTAATAGYIAHDDDIATVVVAYRIHLYLWGEHAGAYPGLPDDVGDAERAARWSSLVRLLETFVHSGKRVVLVLQAPELPVPMPRLVRLAGDAGLAADLVGVDREWWRRRAGYVYSRLGDLPAAVTVIDPAAFFCDRVVCYASRDGVSLYFDEEHMSVAGAMRVAEAVVRAGPPASRHHGAMHQLSGIVQIARMP